MFGLPGLSLQNALSWLLPYLSQAVSQTCLRSCVLGLSPQFLSAK